MRVRYEAFEHLTARQLYKIMVLRQRVFVVEQNCAYLDADNHDPAAHHLWLDDEVGTIAAYLRILPPGEKYPEASLGRVISAPEFRRTGVGRQVVQAGIDTCVALHRGGIRISAQSYLEHFYNDFGFKTVSGMYLEDAIPHVEMLHPGHIGC